MDITTDELIDIEPIDELAKTVETEDELDESKLTPSEKLVLEFAIRFNETDEQEEQKKTGPKRIGRPIVRMGKSLEEQKLNALKKFYIDHKTLAYDEIAIFMGVSKPTVRNIEFRALAKLKEGLAKYGIKNLDDVLDLHKDNETADMRAPAGGRYSHSTIDDTGDDDMPNGLVATCRQNSDGSYSKVGTEEKLPSDVQAIIDECNEEDYM